ncbi:MAG: DUF6444 domain-containing protein [Actinobacteria bacterium]|nr:DUF6444 domain-containing protein [Actinomycetota bacterium]
MLRADNAVLRQQVSTLKDANDVMIRRIVELEKKSGRNSQNSSMPPSSDTFGSPAKEESPNRKARRAMGRKPGKLRRNSQNSGGGTRRPIPSRPGASGTTWRRSPTKILEWFSVDWVCGGQRPPGHRSPMTPVKQVLWKPSIMGQ